MKKLYTLFLALFLLTSVKAAENYEMLVHARDATVLIATKGEDLSGFGSGFFISADGYVVTNYHVVHREKEIDIWFYDEEDPRNYTGEVVGIDPVADLAVLKMDLREDQIPVSYLTFESFKDDIRVGDQIFSIGHMMGLDWTITAGVIGHVNRTSPTTALVRLIQHDAIINRGNSGGPVVNLRGNVVAVNSVARFDEKGNSMGVSHGVRGDHAARSVIQILNTGKVTRVALQAKFRHLAPYNVESARKEYPEEFIPEIFGLLAVEVTEDSYPYSQGLRNMDVVVGVDGDAMSNILQLGDYIVSKNPGDVLKLTVMRDGIPHDIPYTLKELEFDYMAHYDSRMPK